MDIMRLSTQTWLGLSGCNEQWRAECHHWGGFNPPHKAWPQCMSCGGGVGQVPECEGPHVSTKMSILLHHENPSYSPLYIYTNNWHKSPTPQATISTSMEMVFIVHPLLNFSNGVPQVFSIWLNISYIYSSFLFENLTCYTMAWY